MLKLNQITVKNICQSGLATQSSFDRNKVNSGVVHFGVGNFHRCHQAIYFDKLMDKGDLNWGIIGVSLRSPKIRNCLAPQDFLYTQATLSTDSKLHIVGSIKNILVAPENPLAVIQQVSNNSIQLITTTITEKGYYLNSGNIDTRHADILDDLQSIKLPKTLYGYLAAAIIKRHKENGTPFTVLCCDNIQNGGQIIQSGVNILLKKHSAKSLDWEKNNVSYASSMVDRVSPATDDYLIENVRSQLSVEDAWPVSSEPFTQWVIQDNFAGIKPSLNNVGAVFTQDISLYAQMKLQFLNAAHSIISVLANLDGHTTIHKALENDFIRNFTLQVLHKNILPVVKMPADINAKDYIDDVMQRFDNHALPYLAQQVNTDSSQKIQQRWFPTIDDAMAQNKPTHLMSFILAAWVIYVQKALDQNALSDPSKDDLFSLHRKTETLTDQQIVSQILDIAGASKFSFFASEEFMKNVLVNYQRLKTTDLRMLITDVLFQDDLTASNKTENIGHA